MMSEAEIQARIAIRLGKRRDVRLWRQNTGVGRTMDGKRVTRFGVEGGGDLSGIVLGGQRLEVEVKSARGRQSEQQQRFQQMIESFGVIYVLARSEDEAEQQLEQALPWRPGRMLDPEIFSAEYREWAAEAHEILRKQKLELLEGFIRAIAKIKTKPVMAPADVVSLRMLEQQRTELVAELEDMIDES
jgi:hypothetical protein